MEIEAGIADVCPGWQNRPIDEKPKVQPHRNSPYRYRTTTRWGDLLTRTLPGRLALLLGAVILLGIITAAFGHFVLGAYPSFGEAAWHSVAHLIDPGQVGDDRTAAERLIGVIQVLIGIVFLAGIVLTVLTEIFDRALHRLEQGDPALRESGHLLVIGMNETLGEVRTLLTSTQDREHPPIVVMLPPDKSHERQAARRALAGYPSRTQVVVADPRSDGFNRVCATDARHVVILSPDIDPDRADLETTSLAVLLHEHFRNRAEIGPPVGVELRRGRNLDALWYHGSPGGGSPRLRFPATFDALVNDRNIGALFGLAALNPEFAGVLLNQGEGVVAPTFADGSRYVGQTFAAIQAELEGASLLGYVSGSGSDAVARYLPPPDEELKDDQRLIVIRDGYASPAGSHGPGPESVKVRPARPGPVLILGFSDSAGALLEVLDRAGFDPARITVMAPEAASPGAGSQARAEVHLIEGDPCDPQDIARAVEHSKPSFVFAAASPEKEARAVVSGRFARQVTPVTVVVEQISAPNELLEIASDGITVVSTSNLTAETVALAMADPALVVAREQMLRDPGLLLESLTYTGNAPLPLAGLPRIFGDAGYSPLAVSLSGDEMTGLAQGDHVLALHRVGSDGASSAGASSRSVNR